jgi:uncharacterized protein YukE
MADVIRTNYAALEQMAKQCETVATELQDTASKAAKWAQKMQDGALKGPPGDTFADALTRFIGKLSLLAESFNQEARDIRGASSDMSNADGQASGKF